MTSSRWRPHAAMVLAAGLGRRMRHLSRDIPKPMVPLLGVPLIDRVLDGIADAGIAKAVVNVHYLAEVLETHLETRTQPHIVISDERGLLLDTGGGVMKAWAHLGGKPFLIHNSDSVWIEHSSGANLRRLCEAWRPADMDCLMLLAPRLGSLGYEGDGNFDLSADGLLSRRVIGTKAAYVFGGASIVHPRLFDGAPSGAFSLNEVWDGALARGRLWGMALEGTWMHVGTPEAVIEAERLLVADRAS